MTILRKSALVFTCIDDYWLIEATDDVAQTWLYETAPDDADWDDNGRLIEPREIVDVMAAAKAAGLQVRLQVAVV